MKVIPRDLSVEAVSAAASLQRTLERAGSVQIDDTSAGELSMIASDLAASADVLNDALDAIDDYIKEGI